MLATQILPEDAPDNASEDESEIIGHLIIDNKEYEIKRGENSIGRDSCCAIIVDNGTVSKLHAVIESDGKDDTFIYDCGSTNCTKLGKKKLTPYYRYKLDDRADIVLGNIVATFRIAPKINLWELKTRKTIPANTQALDDLNDIFDLPTQVPIPGSSTSSDIPESTNHFKTSRTVLSDKMLPEPSDSKSESRFNVLENSDIFNLSTQCQLPYQTDNVEADKVKSLLNDGQDDVLCNFMLMHSPKQDDVDIFDVPTQIDAVDAQSEALKVTQGKESVLEITLNELDKDASVTQKFDEVTEKQTDVEKRINNTERVHIDGDDDLFTQTFEPSANQANESVLEISLQDEKEDLIITQKFNEVAKDNIEKEVGGMFEKTNKVSGQPGKVSQDLISTQANESVLEISLQDVKEDSIVTQKFNEVAKDNIEKGDGGMFEKTKVSEQAGEVSQDLISTQIYEPRLVEFSNQIELTLSNHFKIHEPKPAENSGDETESDLEIDNEKSITVEQVTCQPEPQMDEPQNSNDSYTFEVDPKRPERDSDATDCEIEPPIKTEPPEMVFEETQVLTLTLPSDFQVNIRTEKRTPSPTCWSQLSLEMPSTPDMETTMNKVLGRENQVGNVVAESPLKRARDSTGSVDPSPAKKPKTDRGLSKLWQVHDITQIQPTRTRYSLRTLDTNKQSCRRSTRERKSNPDITPYLVRGRKKKETRKENTRPLRNRKSRFETPTRKRRTRNDPPVIAFTGFENASLNKTIRELGGEKTNDLSLASVLVADKVRRTVKFLCAIGLSIPITSPKWLSTSKKEKKFVNPLDFILKDEEAEDKWEFHLKSSLERSKRTKLLEGYNVFATESTKPPVKDLLAIVECCGGTPIFNRPTSWPRKTIIVSCEEDEEAWPSPRVRNVKLVHYEFILTGVLRQKIDFKSFSLR